MLNMDRAALLAQTPTEICALTDAELETLHKRVFRAAGEVTEGPEWRRLSNRAALIRAVIDDRRRYA